jgi:TPR repeat protein
MTMCELRDQIRTAFEQGWASITNPAIHRLFEVTHCYDAALGVGFLLAYSKRWPHFRDARDWVSLPQRNRYIARAVGALLKPPATELGIRLTGDQPRRAKMRNLLQKARNGDPASQCLLGMCYLRGGTFPANPARGLAWLRKAAKNGDGEARELLVSKYLSSPHADRNVAKAIRLLLPDVKRSMSADRKSYIAQRQNAMQGQPAAQRELASSYLRGGGVRQNDKKARHWFRRAAVGGDAAAMKSLATCLFSGIGGVQKPLSALVWLWRAEKTKEANAEAYRSTPVGKQRERLLRELGEESESSTILSEACQERIAKVELQRILEESTKSNSGAQFELAQGLLRSESQSNAEEAVELLHEAALYGNDGRAMLLLGLCYLEGRGVKPSHRQARDWLKLAGQNKLFSIVRLQYRVAERWWNTLTDASTTADTSLALSTNEHQMVPLQTARWTQLPWTQLWLVQ